MEKDRLLDIVDKKAVISEPYKVNTLKTKVFYLVICSLLTIHCSLLMGCSLPRIIVLDDPLTPEEHISLGVAYEKKGEIDNAVEEYKKASEKLPIAYFYLGNIHMQMGKMDEAEKYYKKSIRKQPNFADAYNNLAWLYYNKAKGSSLKVEDAKEWGDLLHEAETLALKATELNPSNENYKDTLNKIRELKLKNGL